LGKVISALAEKAVNIGEGEIVYVNVGTNQGIRKGDRLLAFSLFKPRELRNTRVVVIEARLLVTEVKEEEAEALVEDSYRSLSIGSWVQKYEPRQATMPLKPAVRDLQGRIIWSYENLVSFGEGDIVFLDKGRVHGLEPGQCYEIFRTPAEEWGSLREKPGRSTRAVEHITHGIGEIVVLRVEENSSAALVRKSKLPLQVGERFRAGCAWEKELELAKKEAPRVSREGVDLKKAIEEFESKDVLFPYDSYVLTQQARQILQEKAKFLEENPQVRVLIEGHCDERGTKEYNLALGDRRAQAAKRYLVGLGISPDRMRTISYGKERPLDPGHNEEAWARNRRAHFVVEK
jgi:peptidoglycan-associated lipoprotein